MSIPSRVSSNYTTIKHTTEIKFLSPGLVGFRIRRWCNKGPPEVPPARHVHRRPESGSHSRTDLGAEGNGGGSGPGRFRFRGAVIVEEFVAAGVEAPEEEEAGDGGGEEDEYHPQRAHFR